MRRILIFGLMAFYLLLVACSSEQKLRTAASQTPNAPDPIRTVFITSNGWHSGIVLSRAALKTYEIPETGDFPNARYLEFGWGDAAYYPAKTPGVLLALRAGLIPTDAVLHVAALNAEPHKVYAEVESVAITLDPGSLTNLIDFVSKTFDRNGKSRAVSTGPGLYRSSKFYPAHGRFHLANTCNSWTARALAAAGEEIDVSASTRAEDLMIQVRPLAD